VLPELFLLAVMAICIGTAYGTSLAGVSVSLGAFLAGLVVSESRFNSQALGEVLPLQILFSATFFVSIGMLLDLGFLVTNLPMVLGAVAALLILKALTATAALLALGEKLAVAAAAGLTLAQVGEFSFVLAASGASEGLSPPASARTGRRRSSLPPCCSWRRRRRSPGSASGSRRGWLRRRPRRRCPGAIRPSRGRPSPRASMTTSSWRATGAGAAA
jgi:CPA2 family monovalent cation:H+ antiporter-2